MLENNVPQLETGRRAGIRAFLTPSPRFGHYMPLHWLPPQNWSLRAGAWGPASPRDTERVLSPPSCSSCSAEGCAESSTQGLTLMKSPGTWGCSPEPQLHPCEAAEGAKKALIQNSQVPRADAQPSGQRSSTRCAEPKWMLEIFEAS